MNIHYWIFIKQFKYKYQLQYKQKQTRNQQYYQMQDNISYRLYGWGKSFTNTGIPKQIHKQIKNIGVGQNHIFMQTAQGQILVKGSNKFGQLGLSDTQNKYHEQFINVTEDSNFKCLFNQNGKLAIKAIYCGAEHTFVINEKNEVYSMGLNIKGQLGHHDFYNWNKPKLVVSLLPHGLKNSKSLNPILTRISKPPIVQILEKFDLQVKIQEESIESLVLFDGDQFVVKIGCGALFTIALTNKGRIFGCGYQGTSVNPGTNKENQDLLQKAKFREITLDNKIKDISCGLSGAAVLTKEGFVYIWGKFGRLVCNFPKKIKRNKQLSISTKQEEEKYEKVQVGDQFVLLLTNKGQVYSCGENIDNQLGCGAEEAAFKNELDKVIGIPLMKNIYVGRNHCFAINSNNQLYGWGSNRFNQISVSESYPIVMKPRYLDLVLPEGHKIFPSSYFTLLFSTEKILFINSGLSIQKQGISQVDSEHIQLSEYKKLLHDYQVLKSLNVSLLEKYHPPKKTSISVQTSSKFDIDGVVPTKFRKFQANVQIQWSQLELLDRINQGGYGIIYKAKWREILVVVKKFKIENGDVSLRDFLSQCNAMQAVRHPHIVMFLGAVTKPKNYSIILEYCRKGSLWSYLQNLDNNINWDQRKRLAVQIAQGIHYLHEFKPPIIHRDLKSLNIFLDENLRIKIGDFGWTKTLDDYMTNKIGTYQWMAPQVIGNKPYTQKADVFSYSIILWEIASRQPPYRNITGSKVSQAVLNNQLRPTIPKKIPETYVKLMKKCWDSDPSKRPNFKQIIRELQIMKL